MSRPGGVAGWLKDPAFDLALLLGVPALACCMAATAALRPGLFPLVLSLHVWLFGYDHIVATFTKLAGLPQDRARNRRLLWRPIPLFFLLLAAVGTLLGAGALLSGYFFLQFFHTVRQSWGLAQQYRRQAGGLPWDPAGWAELTLWAVPVWGLLHRCQAHEGEFLYQLVWLPRVPAWLVQGSGLVALGLLGTWVVTRAGAFWRGELPLGHTLFLLSHFAVFYGGYVLIEDINPGWLLVNVWHNVQYLAFVWMHNRRRFAGGLRAEARVLSWLSQPGCVRAGAYFLACLALSIPVYLLLFRVTGRLDAWLHGRLVSLALAASLALNLHHYLVDALIWRRARSPG